MKKPLRLDYDRLPFLPHLIAETICGQEYSGQEFSPQLRNPSKIVEIEELRKKMTAEDIKRFADYADDRCRKAYEQEAEWFLKIVRAKGRRGLDLLYAYITHWLVAWLLNYQRPFLRHKFVGD